MSPREIFRAQSEHVVKTEDCGSVNVEVNSMTRRNTKSDSTQSIEHVLEEDLEAVAHLSKWLPVLEDPVPLNLRHLEKTAHGGMGASNK